MTGINDTAFHPTWTALVVFIVGGALIGVFLRAWLKRVDNHPLLCSAEKLQNKDALVIAGFFMVMLLLGLCIAGAGAGHLFRKHVPSAVQLTLVWALACSAVGASFGFLLGHPRRQAEDKAKEERTGTNWLLRTGLDDIADWLVKGITTVLLVNSREVLNQLTPLARLLGGGLQGGMQMSNLYDASSTVTPEAIAFSQGVIVFFTILGALAGCLVTRTYLTGALGRADRSTVGALTSAGLSFSEALVLLRHQRSLGSRGRGKLSPEIARIAQKLAALSLQDLRTPQEFGLWAKAKSSLGDEASALSGYEKAVVLGDSDPALLLDYGVALHAAGDSDGSRHQLEEAHRHLSAATAPETCKNIYKSLTYALLYLDPPQSFERTLKLTEEYEKARKDGRAAPSYGIRVNELCAWGQQFAWTARVLGLLEETGDAPLKVKLPPVRSQWPEDVNPKLRDSFDKALQSLKTILEDDPSWMARLQMLLQRKHPAKKPGTDEASLTDLEAFERFNEFRRLLDLPDWPAEEPVNERDAAEEVRRSASDEPQTKPTPQDPSRAVETEQVPPPVSTTSTNPATGGTE